MCASGELSLELIVANKEWYSGSDFYIANKTGFCAMLQQLVKMGCIYTKLQNVALSATWILSLQGISFYGVCAKINMKDGSIVLKST